jgi:hypothetical protein
MTIRHRITTFLAALAFVLLMVGGLVWARGEASAGSSKEAVGAWYVDTVGAPFEPHGIIFHSDGTMVLTNPDAAEATNSSSAGYGEWTKTKNGIKGRFFEVNADKTTNKFKTILVVDFSLTVDGNKFTGPATATYYDGSRAVVAGPFPAELKGQRFTVTGPIPDPLNQ